MGDEHQQRPPEFSSIGNGSSDGGADGNTGSDGEEPGAAATGTLDLHYAGAGIVGSWDIRRVQSGVSAALMNRYMDGVLLFGVCRVFRSLPCLQPSQFDGQVLRFAVKCDSHNRACRRWWCCSYSKQNLVPCARTDIGCPKYLRELRTSCLRSLRVNDFRRLSKLHVMLSPYCGEGEVAAILGNASLERVADAWVPDPSRSVLSMHRSIGAACWRESTKAVETPACGSGNTASVSASRPKSSGTNKAKRQR